MKQLPILFSGPMVRAILEGRKSMTRRVVRHPEYYGCPTGDCPHETQWACNEAMNDMCVLEDCPYGGPGDLLWVRETWCPLEKNHWFDGQSGRVAYRASCGPDSEQIRRDYIKAGYPYRWRPSIHMPKSAARIWLRVLSVRVERLQEISEEDAIAEGARRLSHGYWTLETTDLPHDMCLATARDAFGNYINQLHGGPRWNYYYNDDGKYPMPIFLQNPYVWVIEFERAEKPEESNG